HVVLPYNREQFRTDSVTVVPGDWNGRFDRVFDGADQTIMASDDPIGSGTSFEYAFLLVDGTARVKAAELDTDLVCVALWDGVAGQPPTFTAAAVEHWRQAGDRLEIIDIRALPGAPPVSSNTTTTRTQASTARFDAQIVGLLFADAHGFSKLREPE